jgi:hypothetical protein
VKPRVKNIFNFAWLCLLVGANGGCINYSEKIVFPSEALLAPLPPDPPPIGSSKLAKAEVAQIETAIFENLLARHLGDDGTYSAVFLHASQATTEALMEKFPHHQPPIKQLWHLEMRGTQSPLDRDTERPALVLSVETLEPENNLVQAIGRWNGGEAVKGFCTFDLGKIDRVWIVLKR